MTKKMLSVIFNHYTDAMRQTLATAFLFLLFTGCVSSAPVNTIPGYTTTTGLDFSEYSEEGFLITPEGYSGDYQSIGILQATLSPTAARLRGNPSDAHVPEGSYIQGDWMINRASTEEVIEALQSRAEEMGADALIRFDLARIENTYTVGANETVEVPQYQVSGFAIDRQ